MASNGDPKGPTGAEIKPPPISKLAEDLLWRIFMINTLNTKIRARYNGPGGRDAYSYRDHDYTPRPLQHTRFSSQVCREWRIILLSSTSIWGRLIDFLSFNNRSHHWRDEVISRSGSSLLWVIGGWHCTSSEMFGWPYRRDTPLNPAQSSFVEFLGNHWERIEKLCVSGWIGNDCSILYRPAPNLKVFHFYPDFYSSQTYGNPDGMFAGHTPRLRSFKTESGNFGLNIIWMSNIRDLSLYDHCEYQFTNREVFEILRLLPCLESLELNTHTMVSGYQPPVVHLRRLHTMKLNGCLDYVHSIEPGSQCSFIIHESLDFFMSNNFIHLDALIKIYNNYLALHPRNEITLMMCSKYELSLSDGSFLEFDLPDHNIFKLCIKSEGDFPMSSVVRFLEAFISPRLSEVPGLTMLLVQWDDLWQQPAVLSAFNKFTASFTSLECLWLSNVAQHILLADELVPSLVFPRLRVVKLLEYSVVELQHFLDSRLALGVPITMLDLTPLRLNRLIPGDFDALDKYVGMIIQFISDSSRSDEYKCGSGNPEVLKFYSRLYNTAGRRLFLGK